MKYGLNIAPSGTLDFIAMGALVHRLDPGVIPFRKASQYQIHVSGGEYNCAANLSDCFHMNTGIISAMVDYPIGDLIADRVRAMGVRPFYKHFKHNGVTGPNMATVYSDRGQGVRAPMVFYNRANEAAAQLKRGDFDGRPLRCALRVDERADHRGDEGCQSRRGADIVRSELSRQAVEHLGQPRTGPLGA